MNKNINENLRCNNCDSLLQSADNLWFQCSICRNDRATKIKFMEEDLNISQYYNLYFNKNDFYYHVYSVNKRKSPHRYYTCLSKIDATDKLSTIIWLQNKDFNLTRDILLKDQANHLLDLLLKMTIFQ
jgi:hypothetical protein